MAAQHIKLSHNGWVDSEKKLVQMPEARLATAMAAQRETAGCDGGRMDGLKLALAGIPLTVLSIAAFPAFAEMPATPANTSMTSSGSVTDPASANNYSYTHPSNFPERILSVSGTAVGKEAIFAPVPGAFIGSHLNLKVPASTSIPATKTMVRQSGQSVYTL